MNCKITKHTDSLESISLEGYSVVTYTTISFPDYRFVYKEDGLKIQSVIVETLCYARSERFIKDNGIMMNGKRVIVIEDFEK